MADKPASMRQRYRRFLLTGAHQPAALPGAAAVVFAPHQDDETLGCGGTILQKRQRGIPVTVVFVTDGSRSHRAHMAPEQMRQVRANEARQAGQALGLGQGDLRFLGFPNSELRQHVRAAQSAVADVLAELRPREVYVPAAWDYHAEHTLTNQIVLAALRQLKAGGKLPGPLEVYEYPIWFYEQWPWVALPPSGDPRRALLLTRSLRWAGGLAFLARFRYAVPTRAWLAQKRAALDCYTSQMSAPSPDSGWATLEGVAGGEFFTCFFQDYEIFHRFVMA